MALATLPICRSAMGAVACARMNMLGPTAGCCVAVVLDWDWLKDCLRYFRGCHVKCFLYLRLRQQWNESHGLYASLVCVCATNTITCLQASHPTSSV